MHNDSGRRKRGLLKPYACRQFWEKGGGEVMGFLVAIPCLMIMLAAIVTVIRIGMFKETLEYAAYRGCRDAVICSNMIAGEAQARKTASEIIEGSSFDDVENLTVQLNYASEDEVTSVVRGSDGNEELYIADDSTDTAGYTSVAGGGSSNSNTWRKGNFITCTVSGTLSTFGNIFSGLKTVAITMMIERPAMPDGDGEYEWFRNL